MQQSGAPEDAFTLPWGPAGLLRACVHTQISRPCTKICVRLRLFPQIAHVQEGLKTTPTRFPPEPGAVKRRNSALRDSLDLSSRVTHPAIGAAELPNATPDGRACCGPSMGSSPRQCMMCDAQRLSAASSWFREKSRDGRCSTASNRPDMPANRRSVAAHCIPDLLRCIGQGCVQSGNSTEFSESASPHVTPDRELCLTGHVMCVHFSQTHRSSWRRFKRIPAQQVRNWARQGHADARHRHHSRTQRDACTPASCFHQGVG